MSRISCCSVRLYCTINVLIRIRWSIRFVPNKLFVITIIILNKDVYSCCCIPLFKCCLHSLLFSHFGPPPCPLLYLGSTIFRRIYFHDLRDLSLILLHKGNHSVSFLIHRLTCPCYIRRSLQYMFRVPPQLSLHCNDFTSACSVKYQNQNWSWRHFVVLANC